MQVINEAKYIKSNAENNNNKYWYIKQYDDNSCMVEWGRVGDSPQSKTHPFTSLDDSTKFFNKKCKEKEGDKKGYTKLKVLIGQTSSIEVKNNDLTTIALSQIKYKDPESKNLIEYLTKVNIHNITNSTTITYSNDSGLFSTPCGIVTQEGIDEARNILIDIGDYVARKSFDDKKYINILQNYLQLIPRDIGRKFNIAYILPDLPSVQKENDILDSLQASLNSVMSFKPNGSAKKDIIPSIFQAKLELLEDKSEHKRIDDKYYSSLHRVHTSSKLKPKNYWIVNIDSMYNDYAKCSIDNINEYWHGSSSANLLSILKSGLRMPSKSSSNVTGRMFSGSPGKEGLYFSSESTKSLNYSQGYWGGKRCDRTFMFLADVRMGNYYVPRGPGDGPFPHKNYHSTWAQANKSGVQNHEMIVYKKNQVNLKYLIEFA